MKIYADVLILTNCILNMIYLTAAGKLIHKSCSGLRLMLASLAGGVSALIIAADCTTYFGAVMISLVKFLSVAGTLLICYKFSGIWQYIRSLGAYLAVRAAFTGMILVFWEISDTKIIYVKNYTVYFHISLLRLTIAVTAAYGLLTLYEFMVRRLSRSTVGFKARYSNGSYQLTLPAIADTGNKLCDTFTGMPVVIFRCSDMYEHFGLDDLETAMRSGFRLIPYTTVSGSGLIPVTPRGSVTIINSKGGTSDVRCYVGVLRSDEGSKAIFDPMLIDN